MCKIASYLKKTSDNWPFVVRTEKVRLFLFRAYNLTPFSIIFMGICIVLGSWLISQSFSTQHTIIEKTENMGGGSIAK